MLGLKSTTSSKWAKLANENLEQFLTDHAFAEQKAAAGAFSLILTYSEESEMVRELSDYAIEEMEHFKLVHELILERKMTLGQDTPSAYAKHLRKFFPKTKDRNDSLINRLLMAAIIEARSCERFDAFIKETKDTALATFYKDLIRSEAGHYTLYLKWARNYSSKEIVDTKWETFATYEATYIKNMEQSALVHG